MGEQQETMRFYLASSFRFVDDVVKLKLWLESKGHKITCEWWHTDFKEVIKTSDDKEWFSNPILKVIYRRSVDAITEADALILVSPEPTKFNGANVEVGIALASSIPVIGYGKIERSGMYEPLVRVSSEEELERVLVEFEV